MTTPQEIDEPRVHNPPRRGQWDPIVVDRGSMVFEPRPSVGRVPPDTICDGWSTPDFTVRLASIRGDAHRHAGRPRQDHAEITLHPPTGTVLFAVADGVSSAPLADIGARIAASCALSAAWRMLDESGTVDWAGVVAAAARAMLRDRDHGLRAGETPADVERRLATTLVAGGVRPGPAGPLVSVVQVGDSGAWLLQDGAFRPILRVKHGGGGPLSSAVEPLPRVPVTLRAEEVPLPPSGVLLVGTDGIGDPLGDGTGLVGSLLAHTLAEPPPMLGFAHVAGFSRETFDDDRTLVAVWSRPGRPR
ncbi:protein phosphatase 2C domain-containing protein [Dactylosporangium sp. NPDC050588]|uniref:protein phosphatase 2C domain-containing protein n=1 Tax=Dactylosporangium sp. NPDC050588 TaxID=3157211 RepID=UPI003407875B